jgi:hypothetical protein
MGRARFVPSLSERAGWLIHHPSTVDCRGSHEDSGRLPFSPEGVRPKEAAHLVDAVQGRRLRSGKGLTTPARTRSSPGRVFPGGPQSPIPRPSRLKASCGPANTGIQQNRERDAGLVEVCSIGLPVPYELWIEALTRTAALQATKRTEQSERLFQRSTAGETDEYLARAVVLRFIVSPARQLPQSPLPRAHRRREHEPRESLDRGMLTTRARASAARMFAPYAPG